MKKKDLIITILCLLSSILFYYIKDNLDIFNLIIALLIYVIFVLSLSHISIYDEIKYYFNKGYFYSKEKIFKDSVISIFIINIIYLVISYFVGISLEKILNINNLLLLVIIVNMGIFIIPFIRLLKEYLIIHNYKKLGNNLFNIYIILNVIYINLISFILSYVKLSNDNKLIIISLSLIINFILLYLFVYFKVLIRRKKLFRNVIKIREENKINYVLVIKKIFKRNKNISFVNIFKYIYYYLSVIISYKVLTDRYYLDINDVKNIIVNTYFYSFILIFIIYLIYNYIVSNKIDDINNNIRSKKYDIVGNMISKLYTNTIGFMLPISIIILFLSGLIWNIIFSENIYSYTLGIMSIYLLFFILYDLLINILLKINNSKILINTLMSGLISFIIIIIPFIDSINRMGYPLILGSILSIIISLIISTLVGSLYLKKYNIKLIDNLEMILNIIYKNIILSIILIILQIMIPIEKYNKINSILILLFYVLIIVIGVVINKIINKKVIKK